MRENFTRGSIPFRKSYLNALVDCIEVHDDRIRIKGSKELLEKAVVASQAGNPPGSQMITSITVAFSF